MGDPGLKSESESCSDMSDSLQPHGLYSPWNSAGQNIGVGSLSLLQEIFPTQGLNLGRPALQAESLATCEFQIWFQGEKRGS